IRLLHVHAPSSPGDDRDTIRCDLQVVDLASERCPPFAALTYVWGTKAAGTNFITCGASTLAIMQNCHSALEHLRKKLGEFTIWVDAICINQDDEGEKMMQIPLMGDIYSNAKTVYVWLG
ncbi:HET-domain-containing protein, partial [Glonium stellatum]